MNSPAFAERFQPPLDQPDLTTQMPRLQADEPIGPGDVVGVRAGGVSRRTDGADWVQVVRAKPELVTDRLEDGAPVQLCLLGHTQVRTVGWSRRGDLLLASGHEDGTAVAVPAKSVIPEIAHWVLGRALRDKRGSGEALLPISCMLPQALLNDRYVLTELLFP